MELIHQYETQLKEFETKGIIYFNGSNTETNDYILGITPQDPQNIGCFYFNVSNVYKITNKDNGVVFNFICWTCFVVKVNPDEKVTAEFYFELICKAYQPFLELLKEKTKGTHIYDHTPIEPIYSILKQDIQKAIDIWDRDIRNMSLN